MNGLVPRDLSVKNLGVSNILVVRQEIATPIIITQEVASQDISANSRNTNTNITANRVTANEVITNTLSLRNTTNQITSGGLTLNLARPSSSITYTIPDVGSDANMVMTAGAQTVGGAKTFTDTTTFGSAIYLPTSGGVPAPLSFYEEYSSTLDFQSNAFSGTRTINYNIVRVGSMVTLFLGEMATGAASGSPGSIVSFNDIPSRFMFTSDTNCYSFANVRSNSVPILGTVFVRPIGTVTYYAGPTPSQFAATGTITLHACTVSWTLPGPDL